MSKNKESWVFPYDIVLARCVTMEIIQGFRWSLWKYVEHFVNSWKKTIQGNRFYFGPKQTEINLKNSVWLLHVQVPSGYSGYHKELDSVVSDMILCRYSFWYPYTSRNQGEGGYRSIIIIRPAISNNKNSRKNPEGIFRIIRRREIFSFGDFENNKSPPQAIFKGYFRAISRRKREFCLKINLRRAQIWTSEKNIIIKARRRRFFVVENNKNL